MDVIPVASCNYVEKDSKGPVKWAMFKNPYEPWNTGLNETFYFMASEILPNIAAVGLHH